MLKIKEFNGLLIWIGICIFTAISNATQRKMSNIHLVAAANCGSTWVSSGMPNMYNSYAHMQQGFSERVRELSFNLTPNTVSTSSQSLQLVAQKPAQVAQASRVVHGSDFFVCSELQVADRVSQYVVKISSFSNEKLRVENDTLVKELNSLQSDLRVWENLRMGLLSSMGFPENYTYHEVESSWNSNIPCELEARYLQNEKRICDLQNSIGFKEQCLQQTQTLLKAAEVKATTHAVQQSKIITASSGDNSIQITMSAKEPVAVYSRFESALKTFDSKQFLDPLDREVLAAFKKTMATKGLSQDIVIESEITREGYEGLKSVGIDSEQFKEAFKGNALQKYFASKVYEMINNSGNTLAGSQDTNIRAYAEATDHVCEAAHDMILANDPLQVLIWTKVASLCDQATAVAKGFVCGTARGMLESVEGIVDIIKDPQQFVDNCKTVVRLWLSINDEGKLEGDDKLLRKVAGMFKEFDQLPFAQKVEYTSAMVATIAGPVKVTSSVFKALASVTKVMKLEAGSLRALQLRPLTSMKGALVPFKYASTMLKLISNGTITTGQEITRWLKLLNGPLNWGMTEAIHDVIKPLANAFSKEKVAATVVTQQVAKTMAATQQATKTSTKVAALALTAASMASASFGTSALIESATKSILASSIARQGVQSATSALGDVSQMAKSTLGAVSEGVGLSNSATALTSAVYSSSAAASESKIFAAAQHTAQEVSASSSTAETVATQATETSAKVSKEEAVRNMQPNRRVLTEVEVKAIREAAKEASEGCKNLVITEGERRVGEIAQVPIAAPTSKGFWHHVFRAWKKKRDIKGCHMPAQRQPELISEVTGSNALGIKEVTLKMGNATAIGKTIAPSHWKLVDYANHCKEAYAYVKKTEEIRDGVLMLTGIDKSGITWEMLLELKEGEYKLTTAYPTLEIIGL